MTAARAQARVNVDLELRAYRPEDRARILELLASTRPAGYLSEKAAVFDWQFHANPASARSPFVIGTLGDEIVAVNGLMPVSIRFGGEITSACWSLDTYVSGDHRGRGFGKALVAKVSTSAPVMLGFGISDMSDPIFEKQGWELDRSMATVFHHASESGLKGLAKNLLTRSSRRLRAAKPLPLIDVAVEREVSSGELDALWARVAEQFPNAVERTAAYLTWRYRDAPVLRYRWVAARRDGRLSAVLVTRHHPDESVIVDYLGPVDDLGLLTSIVDVACSDLVAAGTRRVRCETNHPVMLEALADTGFVRHRDAGRFRVRSNLPASPGQQAGWFVMTGDSDNDLLVL